MILILDHPTPSCPSLLHYQATYVERSPITNVDKFKAPILLLQGPTRTHNSNINPNFSSNLHLTPTLT